MEFYVKTQEDLKEISKKFSGFINKFKIFALIGEIGVGKTTFIRYLANEMKIQEQVSSPTFGYVNEYFSPAYGKIYHLDLYRIESEDEAYNIGIEDYIYTDAIVFIEWAEKISNLLPKDCVWVYFSKNEYGHRKIEMNI